MKRKSSRVFDVLLVDDSEVDRVLIRRALSQSGRLQIVAEVESGADAIAYFCGDGHYGDRRKFPLPDLLLLDLKMPGLDGFHVLEWLRSRPQPAFSIVVLTASVRPEDIKRALDLGADLFQVKPHSLGEFQALNRALEEHLAGAAVTMAMP